MPPEEHPPPPFKSSACMTVFDGSVHPVRQCGPTRAWPVCSQPPFVVTPFPCTEAGDNAHRPGWKACLSVPDRAWSLQMKERRKEREGNYSLLQLSSSWSHICLYHAFPGFSFAFAFCASSPIGPHFLFAFTYWAVMSACCVVKKWQALTSYSWSGGGGPTCPWRALFPNRRKILLLLSVYVLPPCTHLTCTCRAVENVSNSRREEAAWHYTWTRLVVRWRRVEEGGGEEEYMSPSMHTHHMPVLMSCLLSGHVAAHHLFLCMHVAFFSIKHASMIFCLWGQGDRGMSCYGREKLSSMACLCVVKY